MLISLTLASMKSATCSPFLQYRPLRSSLSWFKFSNCCFSFTKSATWAFSSLLRCWNFSSCVSLASNCSIYACCCFYMLILSKEISSSLLFSSSSFCLSTTSSFYLILHISPFRSSSSWCKSMAFDATLYEILDWRSLVASEKSCLN